MGSLYISNSLVTHKIGCLVQTNIVLQILHGYAWILWLVLPFRVRDIGMQPKNGPKFGINLHSGIMWSPLQKHLELNLRSCGVHHRNIWSWISGHVESTTETFGAESQVMWSPLQKHLDLNLRSCGVHYRNIWSWISDHVESTTETFGADSLVMWSPL